MKVFSIFAGVFKSNLTQINYKSRQYKCQLCKVLEKHIRICPIIIRKPDSGLKMPFWQCFCTSFDINKPLLWAVKKYITDYKELHFIQFKIKQPTIYSLFSLCPIFYTEYQPIFFSCICFHRFSFTKRRKLILSQSRRMSPMLLEIFLSLLSTVNR